MYPMNMKYSKYAFYFLFFKICILKYTNKLLFKNKKFVFSFFVFLKLAFPFFLR